MGCFILHRASLINKKRIARLVGITRANWRSVESRSSLPACRKKYLVWVTARLFFSYNTLNANLLHAWISYAWVILFSSIIIKRIMVYNIHTRSAITHIFFPFSSCFYWRWRLNSLVYICLNSFIRTHILTNTFL
jgi:hypothetical protein